MKTLTLQETKLFKTHETICIYAYRLLYGNILLLTNGLSYLTRDDTTTTKLTVFATLKTLPDTPPSKLTLPQKGGQNLELGGGARGGDGLKRVRNW